MEDLLHEVLRLAASVCEAAQHVRVAQEDCRKLAKGIKAISRLLTHVRLSLLNLPRQQVEPALQVLQDALVTTDDILPLFNMQSSLCAVVYSGDLKGKLQNVGMMLGAAVGMLPAVQLSTSYQEQEQIQKLSKELQNAGFTMLDALQRLCSRVEYLMQYDEQKLIQLIMRILDSSHKSKVTSEKELIEMEVQRLKEHLMACEDDGDPEKEQNIHCLIALLNMRQLDLSEDTSQQPSYQLLDPLSLKVMKDPVVLVESVVTYDRSSLEDWMGKKGMQAFVNGELVDPLTGQVLTAFPPSLMPNIDVRRAVKAWQQTAQVDSGALSHRSTASAQSPWAPSTPSADSPQASFDELFSPHMTFTDVGPLRGLLLEKWNLHLPEPVLRRLATALQDEAADDEEGGALHRVIQLVDTVHQLFASLNWRNQSVLQLDEAYEVFTAAGFRYKSFAEFKEACCLQQGSTNIRSLSLGQLLMVISSSLFELWKNFQHMACGGELVTAKQLLHALQSHSSLSKLLLADVQSMIRYHTKGRLKAVDFFAFWKMHNYIVSVLTAFTLEDRGGSGYVKEDQVLRMLLQLGMVNVTQSSVRDAWRKVAGRQMQLSCVNMLGVFYHLLQNDAQASQDVQSLLGVLRSQESLEDNLCGPGNWWPFQVFWESLEAGKLLCNRYEVLAKESVTPQVGTCMAHDCYTCSNVQIRFFFNNKAYTEEMAVMRQLQSVHTVNIIQSWEAEEYEEGSLPAGIVTPVCATLHGWLEQQKLKPSPLSERKELIGQVLEALTDLETNHRVHLGLTPHKIVYSWDAKFREYRWKLLGLHETVPLGQPGLVPAPQAFVAPELVDFCGSGEPTGVDGFGSHVWSLGVIALQALTGIHMYHACVNSPWVVKKWVQEQLPTHMHRSRLLNIVGPAELSLLDSMLQVEPHNRKTAQALLREFFPLRAPTDMEMDSPRPTSSSFKSKPAVGSHGVTGAGLSMFRSWHSAAQWALQPANNMQQQLNHAQGQVKAYTAEIAFYSKAMVRFPWPSTPIPDSPISHKPIIFPAAASFRSTSTTDSRHTSTKPKATVDIASLAFKADHIITSMLWAPFSKTGGMNTPRSGPGTPRSASSTFQSGTPRSSLGALSTPRAVPPPSTPPVSTTVVPRLKIPAREPSMLGRETLKPVSSGGEMGAGGRDQSNDVDMLAQNSLDIPKSNRGMPALVVRESLDSKPVTNDATAHEDAQQGSPDVRVYFASARGPGQLFKGRGSPVAAGKVHSDVDVMKDQKLRTK